MPVNMEPSLDSRDKFKLMIEKFLIDKVIGNKIEKKDEPKSKDEIINEDKPIHDLNKIYMLDLESSLNVMLRSEISHSQTFDEEKLTVLKQWVKTLAKVNIYLI